MIDILFIIFTLVYLWISIKVENWITIYYLGFKTETPLLFLKNKRIYDIIRVLLFLTCVVLSFFTVYISLFICLLIIAIVWVLSGKIGRNQAFNKYREILIDLAEHELDNNQKAEYLEASKKSNDVLQNEATQAMKFGL